MPYDKNAKKLGNQEVLSEVEEQWYKIGGILTAMFNAARGKPVTDEVQITIADVERFLSIGGSDDSPAVIYHPDGDIIRLRVLPEREAKRLHRL